MKRNGLLNKFLLIGGGAVVGALNGFFGGGGGILCVPLLLFFNKLEDKEAHATALTVILPLTVVSAIVYILNGTCDITLTLEVSAGVLAGGVLGAILLSKLKNKYVALIFALIMIGAGIKLIVG